MENKDEIKQGDIVLLQSGPAYWPMTVEAIVNEKEVVCVWVDRSGKPHREKYSLTSLRKKCP